LGCENDFPSRDSRWPQLITGAQTDVVPSTNKDALPKDQV